MTVMSQKTRVMTLSVSGKTGNVILLNLLLLTSYIGLQLLPCNGMTEEAMLTCGENDSYYEQNGAELSEHLSRNSRKPFIAPFLSLSKDRHRWNAKKRPRKDDCMTCKQTENMPVYTRRVAYQTEKKMRDAPVQFIK